MSERTILLPGLGTFSGTKPMLPVSSLPQHSTAAVLAQRLNELAQAQIDNPFNSTVLEGAVVHGNMKSPDVTNNLDWMLRGTDEQRAALAQEDDFGVDDADPAEDTIDLLEPLVSYVEKNLTMLLQNANALNLINQLFRIVYGNLVDTLGVPLGEKKFKFEIIDPILALLPPKTASNLEELNFFPLDASRFPKPAYAEEFRDDDVMGWLQVAPISPTYDSFKPYTEHLSKFPVTNAMFRQTEGFEDDDLDYAMTENRVFITDFAKYHEEVVNEPTNDGYGARLHAAMALFAMPKGGDTLKIIAIQPTQTPSPNNWAFYLWDRFKIGDRSRPISKILTPKDDYWSWQMAKNLFTSMTSMGAVVDHLGMHVYLGPIPVAFYRTIPDHHPLTALLETHFMSLVDNNYIGIFNEVGIKLDNSELSGNGIPHDGDFGDPLNGLLTGAVERLSGLSSEGFVSAVLKQAGSLHFADQATPLDRNLHPEFDSLGDYPFHDDNRALAVIHDWVSDYLSLYYASNDDVSQDSELQNFFNAVAVEGNVNGFPASVNSITDLVDTISRLIYWMSVNHGLDRFTSFINLGSTGYYSDRLPQPSPVRPKTENDWFGIMPPLNVGMGLFIFSRIFVDLPRDWHRSLGKYPDGQFMHDQRIYQHLEKFQTNIRALDDEIRQTNTTRRWSCELRMPSTLTVSPWN